MIASPGVQSFLLPLKCHAVGHQPRQHFWRPRYSSTAHCFLMEARPANWTKCHCRGLDFPSSPLNPTPVRPQQAAPAPRLPEHKRWRDRAWHVHWGVGVVRATSNIAYRHSNQMGRAARQIAVQCGFVPLGYVWLGLKGGGATYMSMYPAR